jgi:hypothetical protein
MSVESTLPRDKLGTLRFGKAGKGGNDLSKASNCYRPFGNAQGGRESTEGRQLHAIEAKAK